MPRELTGALSRDQEVSEEFESRVAREIAKAVEKYGEVALAPAGHPEYDVYDYLINELVGLVRYGQIVAARTKMLKATGCISHKQNVQGRQIAELVQSFGEDAAKSLIDFRLGLKDRGLMLGKPEVR